MGLDGEDAGQPPHPDAVGHHPGEATDEGRKARAHHGAQYGELVLEVDAVHGRLGHPQIGGDGGGNRDLALVLLAADQDDAYHRRGLGDVGERNQRPDGGAAHALHQLQIHRVGSVVNAGDDQGRIEEAKQGSADGGKWTGHGRLGGKADPVTNPAAERADEGVGHDHRQQQGDKGDYDQVEVGRDDALQVRLDPGEEDPRQQGRNDLGLIAHLLDDEEAKVPHLGGLLADAIGVHQLGRH